MSNVFTETQALQEVALADMEEEPSHSRDSEPALKLPKLFSYTTAPKKRTATGAQMVIGQISQYFDMPCDDVACPIVFWQTNKEKFSLLYNFALRVLSVVILTWVLWVSTYLQ